MVAPHSRCIDDAGANNERSEPGVYQNRLSRLKRDTARAELSPTFQNKHSGSPKVVLRCSGRIWDRLSPVVYRPIRQAVLVDASERLGVRYTLLLPGVQVRPPVQEHQERRVQPMTAYALVQFIGGTVETTEKTGN